MKSLQRLTRLDLPNNAITAAGAAALSGWVGLRRVTHLDLNGNRLGDDGVRALFSGPCSQRIASLNLDGNVVRAGGPRTRNTQAAHGAEGVPAFGYSAGPRTAAAGAGDQRGGRAEP